jgi:hypothetical protein
MGVYSYENPREKYGLLPEPYGKKIPKLVL